MTQTEINAICTKYGTQLEPSAEDASWATKHPLVRESARALAQEINDAGGEASTSPDQDDRSREWVHVTVGETAYTIKSIKHNETHTGSLQAAIERAGAILGEYRPAYGVQVEDEDGETVWDSEDRRNDLLSALSDLDDGTGTLGIIVDQALADDPNVSEDTVRAIVVESIEDAKVERSRGC
jgi:hypothetical protein